MGDIPGLDGWYTKPTVVTLEDGVEVTVTPCVLCRWPTIPLHTHEARPDARGLGRRHAARGCCERCYDAIRHTEKWYALKPRQRDIDEVLDDWVIVRQRDEPMAAKAASLGMSARGLRTALYRARKRGDERARLTW